jgi:hypothetical protein
MQRRSNDPIKTAARKAKAQRRVGQGAACTRCGDGRPDMLVRSSRPKLCLKCYALENGTKTTQSHHVAGRANSPLTVEISVTDHRTLSEAQYEWPPETLRNVDGSPLLCAAGALRGTCDFIAELILRLIECCAEFLENLDAWLREKYGLWWNNTPFDGWQRK